ncbi:MAG: adenylate kinase [Candidatus Altiarchaeales archaeon]|nr:MAG: adenylate kinase [Candidatus Altiarchaeales archaeon]HDI72558.1 adenylate kinase [Candidatus Altiarchaeales archaeon]
MLAVLTGIPGTGKTTVAKKALEILRGDNISYELVTYGDIMFDIAKSENLVEDRDQMRKLNPEQQKKIQKEAARRISEMGAGKNIIVDTHCTIRTPRGYLPGLPKWVLDELKPDVFIIIEAKPKEIAMRRQEDKTRQRDGELTEEIRLHQELNRDIAMAYSVLSGCTVKIVKNPQGRIDEAARNMSEILR